ncbi:MAG: integrase arm-type DNA-binding domain-containing protein [Desulfovibrio sp.]|jgi:integrase|nr:integrase arm-type DNA-binding domain-containing protein [Desulfovibrio sp.]
MPLSDAAIRSAKPKDKNYKLFDGYGLYLEVTPNGGKWWRLKYRFAGKEKRISLGTYPTVSLKDARIKAQDAKRCLGNGTDPSFQKRRVLIEQGQLFSDIANEWLEGQREAVTEKTLGKNKNEFERHVFPFIGNARMREVAPPDVLAVCRRIEKGGATYLAHKVLGLCSRVFRYAVASGIVNSDPCRDLVGALRPHQSKNRAALTSPSDVRRLLLAIDAYTGTYPVVCALKLAPMLFVRPGELRKAEWAEFDIDAAEWRIPASKMKMREEHLVPLAKQALSIIADLRVSTGHGRYLFPSPRTLDRPMSDNAILSALRYMGFAKEEIVGHGFRAMASTLLNEQGWPPDVIERQLAHAERNKVRSAYNRALYMKERRAMMQSWADYLDSLRCA